MTVAKEIELEDPYENMGAQLVREVASKTSGSPVMIQRPQPFWRKPKIYLVALGEQFIEFRLCEHAAQKWKVAWLVTPSLFHD